MASICFDRYVRLINTITHTADDDEKVNASVMELGGFPQVLRFPPLLTTG